MNQFNVIQRCCHHQLLKFKSDKYGQEMLQSQTAGQPMALLGRDIK